jgi:hypothetical protein
MTGSPGSEETIQVELRVLQALCQGTPGGSLRASAERILKTYRWREPLHQIIFETLMSVPTESPDVIRDQLPSRLTRRGFPDVAWENFFKPHSLKKNEAECLMRQLAEPR